MNEIEKCLGDHTKRLDTLIGIIEHLSQVVTQAISPATAFAPLMAFSDAPVYGTAIDTPQQTSPGRIRAAIVSINAGNGDGALVQVFARQAALPGGQVEMFHGWVGSGIPANVLAEGTHIPQGTSFRIVASNQGGGSLQELSLAVYVDPVPMTGAEVFRSRRP